MKNKFGDSAKVPEISSMKEALEEILEISKDKRTHILVEDALDWEQLKLKAIKKIAKLGLKSNN